MVGKGIGFWIGLGLVNRVKQILMKRNFFNKTILGKTLRYMYNVQNFSRVTAGLQDCGREPQPRGINYLIQFLSNVLIR